MQGSVFSSMSGIIKTATGSTARAQKKARSTKTSAADVVSAPTFADHLNMFVT